MLKLVALCGQALCSGSRCHPVNLKHLECSRKFSVVSMFSRGMSDGQLSKNAIRAAGQIADILVKQSNDQKHLIQTLTDLGVVHARRNEFGRALPFFKRALQVSRTADPSLRNHRALSTCWVYLARFHWRYGQPRDALPPLRARVRLARQLLRSSVPRHGPRTACNDRQQFGRSRASDSVLFDLLAALDDLAAGYQMCQQIPQALVAVHEALYICTRVMSSPVAVVQTNATSHKLKYGDMNRGNDKVIPTFVEQGAAHWRVRSQVDDGGQCSTANGSDTCRRNFTADSSTPVAEELQANESRYRLRYCELMTKLGELYGRSGDQYRARACHVRAVTCLHVWVIDRNSNCLELLQSNLLSLGEIYEQHGNLAVAEKLYRRVLRLAAQGRGSESVEGDRRLATHSVAAHYTAVQCLRNLYRTALSQDSLGRAESMLLQERAMVVELLTAENGDEGDSVFAMEPQVVEIDTLLSDLRTRRRLRATSRRAATHAY